MLTSARDITARVRPPRSAFLDYPLGNQTGHPGRPAEQRKIVEQTLRLVETVQQPGEIVDLPYEWEDPNWQEQTIALYRQDAATVLRQRTTGEYRDGMNYAQQECKDVCSLI